MTRFVVRSAASSLLVFVVGMLVVLTMFAPRVARAAYNRTYQQAQAECEAFRANYGDYASNYACVDWTGGGCNAVALKLLSRGDYASSWCYDGEKPFDCAAAAGQVIPAGTQVDTYPSTGAVCHNGCAVSLVLNGTSIGPPTGSNVYTGQSCPVSSTGTPGALTPPSQTYNPDGTTTYCDTLSGKCVTFGGSPSAPASPSSTPSHSTDTTSNTTTSPTTTTTTTTTTNNSTTVITGDGSGGTGTGMGNGTATTSGSSTSTSTTDAPASSSSTSSKCTTGVCDVGDADGQIGGIYTGNPSTPGQAYQSFVAQVRTAPIMQAATSFFTVNASGSCPTWHFAGNPYWGPSGLDFTLFCDPAMLTLLQLAGLIVLATAAFSAFRIAIY